MEARLHEISTTTPYGLHVGVVALVLLAPDNDRKEVFPMWWGYHGWFPFAPIFCMLLLGFVVFRMFAFRPRGWGRCGGYSTRRDAWRQIPEILCRGPLPI